MLNWLGFLVDFINQFWVKQNDPLPSIHYLFVFTIYHIIGLIFLITSYFVIINRIKTSLSGPNPTISADTPPILLTSIRWVYLSLILMELSVVINHISPILHSGYPDNGAIWGIGVENPLIALGIFFLPFGLFNLTNEIVEPEKYDQLRFVKTFIFFLTMIFIVEIVILSHETLDILSYVFGTMWLIWVAYYFKQISLFNILNTTNPTLKLRLRFITLPLLITTLFVFMNFIITVPHGSKHIIFRTSSVHYLILLNEAYTILCSFSIYIGITLPRWVRRLSDLEDNQYYQNLDYRFDFFWEDNNRVLLDLDFEIYEDPSTSPILFTYSDRLSKDVVRDLQIHIPGEVISSTRIFKENYLLRYKLPGTDLILLSSKPDDLTKYFLNHIRSNYKVKIEFDGKLKIYDHYPLESNKFKFAFFAVFPSIWNIKNKIWLILIEKGTEEVIVDFLVNYHLYYRNINRAEAMFSFLQFPIEGDVVLPIPPLKESDIPSQNYVQVI